MLNKHPTDGAPSSIPYLGFVSVRIEAMMEHPSAEGSEKQGWVEAQTDLG